MKLFKFVYYISAKLTERVKGNHPNLKGPLFVCIFISLIAAILMKLTSVYLPYLISKYIVAITLSLGFILYLVLVIIFSNAKKHDRLMKEVQLYSKSLKIGLGSLLLIILISCFIGISLFK